MLHVVTFVQNIKFFINYLFIEYFKVIRQDQILPGYELLLKIWCALAYGFPKKMVAFSSDFIHAR